MPIELILSVGSGSAYAKPSVLARSASQL